MASDGGMSWNTEPVLPSTPWEPRSGSRVGRFTLRERLGTGGQGQAWLAVDPNRSSPGEEGWVVVKFLAPDVRRDENRTAEFRATYMAAQRLHHEAICPLLDLEQDPAVGLFQVMHYQRGQTLRQLLDERVNAGRPISPAEVLKLLEPIARALDHIHNESVVHGDVKPENLIWDAARSQIALIDFGLAVRFSEPRQKLPGQGIAHGTERYCSPELWQGYQPAPSDDRWALAVTAWELCCGQAPFAGTGWALRDDVHDGVLQSPAAITGEVRQVFEQALHVDQDRRPRSCCALFDLLKRALGTAGARHVTVDPVFSEFPRSVEGSRRMQQRFAEAAGLPLQIETAWASLRLIPPGWAVCGDARTVPERLQKLAAFRPAEQYLRAELPPARYELRQPLYVSLAPVTVSEFERFLSETGYEVESDRDGTGGFGYDSALRRFRGPVQEFDWQHVGWPQTGQHPVVNVSWNDAEAFAGACNQFSRVLPNHQLRFRLPTELEWEYACRAGSAADFWFGDEIADLGRYGNVTDGTKRREWPSWPGLDTESGFRFTSPVRHFPANPFGLYDMHGNVRQWCSDVFPGDPGSRYAGQPCRVVRGGAWCNSPMHARCSARALRPISHRDDHIGIRIVAEVQAVRSPIDSR